MNERDGDGAIISHVRGTVVRLAHNPYVGVGLVAFGVLAAVVAMSRQGADGAWPYLYAHGLWEGHPIFSTEWRQTNMPGLVGYYSEFALFWPAAMGVVMLPLAALPYGTAKVVLLLVGAAALAGGVWALFGLARPQTPWPVRLTVAGLVLLTACARWCFTANQIAPLLAGLLVATLVGLHRGRPWMAFLATTAVIAIKPTLAVPFLLLLLLHRRYKILVLVLGTNVVLNALAFSRFGGFDAISDYRAGTATLEQRGGINTPNFWEHVSVQRTDWIYLVTGLTGSFGLGRAVALLTGAAVGLFLCLACLRMAQPASLADSCRIMLAGNLVGLLIVYHHHYDLALLIPPLLLAAMVHRELGLSWSRWMVWSLMPITFLMLFVPASRAPDVMGSLVGDRGPGLVRVLFPLAETFALVGSLAMVLESTGSVADWKAWITAPRRQRLTRRST